MRKDLHEVAKEVDHGPDAAVLHDQVGSPRVPAFSVLSSRLALSISLLFLTRVAVMPLIFFTAFMKPSRMEAPILTTGSLNLKPENADENASHRSLNLLPHF